jgi:hypothetical protein
LELVPIEDNGGGEPSAASESRPPERAAPPAATTPVKSWPIGVIIAGELLTGGWSVISGIWVFFLLGGADVWGKWNGEWGGIGGLLQIASVLSPLWGICHLLVALGIHRRRSWARYLLLGLSSITLLQSVRMACLGPSSLLLFWPGLAFAIFTIVVLLSKPYANQFRARGAAPQSAAPLPTVSDDPAVPHPGAGPGADAAKP